MYTLYRHHHIPILEEIILLRKNRKEVIQEQLPLPLPCYDLIRVTDPSVSPDINMGLRLLPAPLS